MTTYSYRTTRTGHGPRHMQRPPAPEVRERANLAAPILALWILATVVLVALCFPGHVP